nr:MAG TPA: hypothetical protein [Caudoviricetes sp.]DAO68544.1 MAG TPA: hypothetical protein [Caudoviricetes sp.]
MPIAGTLSILPNSPAIAMACRNQRHIQENRLCARRQ